MKKTEKSAAAYLRDGAIFLHPYSQTTEGFWIFISPVIRTAFDDTSLGKKLLIILSQSGENISHPKSWKGLTDPLLRVAGVRSFNIFAKSAKCVGIRLDESSVVFTPTRNGGPKQAFLHLNDKTICCQPSETELMSSLRKAFDDCE